MKNVLVLIHYQPLLPIIAAAEASDYRIGTVLLHKYPKGSQKAVFQVLYSLTKSVKNTASSHLALTANRCVHICPQSREYQFIWQI